jgi:hypothetical protein
MEEKLEEADVQLDRLDMIARTRIKQLEDSLKELDLN